MHEAAKASDEMNADSTVQLYGLLCARARYLRAGGAAIESANCEYRRLDCNWSIDRDGNNYAVCRGCWESGKRRGDTSWPKSLPVSGIDTGGRDFNPFSELTAKTQ